MNTDIEPRESAILTPNIFWKVKSFSNLTKKESSVYYFFKAFWKFSIETDCYVVPEEKGCGIAIDIKINMIVHKASKNYPKISFSVICGIVTDEKSIALKKDTLIELTDKHKNFCIWLNDIDYVRNFLGASIKDITLFIGIRMNDNLENYTKLANEPAPVPPVSQTCLSSLIQDLQKSKEDSIMTDVILKCGDVQLSAHKCMLSCRSPVFQAMFQNDFKESRNNIVEISDVEPSVFEQLIDYIYSGNAIATGEPMEFFCNLYKAAHKYCIESLKEKCVSFIMDNLEQHYACDVLLMADLYMQNDLKKHVISFLAKKKEFLLSEEWRKFAKVNMAVAQEVFFSFVSNAEIDHDEDKTS